MKYKNARWLLSTGFMLFALAGLIELSYAKNYAHVVAGIEIENDDTVIPDMTSAESVTVPAVGVTTATEVRTDVHEIPIGDATVVEKGPRGLVAVAGCWAVVVDLPWPMSDKKVTFCFEVNAGQASGRVKFEDKWVPMRQLHVDGNKFDFVVDSPAGTSGFAGKVSAQSMKGEISTSRGNRPFTGRRK